MQLIFANDLIDLETLSQWHASRKVISGVAELQNVGGIAKNNFSRVTPELIRCCCALLWYLRARMVKLLVTVRKVNAELFKSY